MTNNQSDDKDVKTLKCHECGDDLPINAESCPSCGAIVLVENATNIKSDESSINQSQELILLLSAIFFLIIYFIILYFVQNKYKSSFDYTLRDFANPFWYAFLPVISFVIIYSIISSLKGRLPYLRKISGLDAIDEAIGRATEMGRPILFSGGLSGISIVSLQALAVAAKVAKAAVKYGTRLIIPVCDQTMLPVTEEVIREVYMAEGKPEAFRMEDVRFLSDRQFAYAAGVTGIIHRDKVGANFMFGDFFAEALILAENGNAVGAIQVAGTPEINQTPFFVVTCDYTLIGDEFYAATAYLSRDPIQMGSLTGQDLSKIIIIALIFAGMILSIVQKDNIIIKWLGG
ncbi:MAG: zinc ribbon domain-containing protein [bacterium]